MKFTLNIEGLKVPSVEVGNIHIESECTPEEYMRVLELMVPTIENILDEIDRQSKRTELLFTNN